jgi:uncharacterized coiled-coil protein SlyX
MPIRDCLLHLSATQPPPGSRPVRSPAMATTFADIEARVRGLESRMQRAEEDITAIITTVIETRDDVKWLKRAVQALLADRNITLDETEDD